jgi:hypothetical protein
VLLFSWMTLMCTVQTLFPVHYAVVSRMLCVCVPRGTGWCIAVSGWHARLSCPFQCSALVSSAIVKCLNGPFEPSRLHNVASKGWEPVTQGRGFTSQKKGYLIYTVAKKPHRYFNNTHQFYSLHNHFNFIKTQSLDMFRPSLAHPQEALHEHSFGGWTYCKY